MFHHVAGGRFSPLDKPEALFAWMRGCSQVCWSRAGITKYEFFAALQQQLPPYAWATPHPHFPALPDVHYPAEPPPAAKTGALGALLDRFCPVTQPVSPRRRPAFLQARTHVHLIVHDAAQVLAALAPLAAPAVDMYALVEGGQVWDIGIAHRLVSLATAGHAANAAAGLADCARTYLGLDPSPVEAGQFPDPVRQCARVAVATWQVG